jgi:hypothetical protein
MTLTESTARGAGTAVRQIGYLLAVLINIGILFAVNVVPGWDVLPFLTADTGRVLPVVNLSLVVGAVANLAYVAYDSGWFKPFGDLIIAAVGLAALARIWVVFPFDFSAYSLNWGLVTRVVLVIAIVGSAIGTLAQLFGLVREVVGRGDPRSLR